MYKNRLPRRKCDERSDPCPRHPLGEPATMIGQRTPKQSLFLLVAVVLLVCGSATSSLAADQPPKSASSGRGCSATL